MQSIDKKLRDIVKSILVTHQIGDEALLMLLLKISRVCFKSSYIISSKTLFCLGIRRDLIFED